MKRSSPGVAAAVVDADATSTTPQGSSAHSDAAASSPRKVKLLLHTVDGVVPYLTPSLLRKCLPPDRNPHLWLGIAVRDTCVVPEDDKNKNEDNKPPKGHTFGTPRQVDSWIRDYPRVTVPTFDLLNDATTAKAAAASSKNALVTNQHVMLWTSNGRLPLTPNLYFKAAQGLDSQAVVPLFDVILPCSINDDRCKNNPQIKRKQSAMRRCEEWYHHCRAALRQQQEEATATTKTLVYAPVVIDPQPLHRLPCSEDGADDDNDDDALSDELKSHLDDFSYARQEDADGIVVIGWHYLPDSLQRRQVLSTLFQQTSAKEVCVLVTESLTQFLDAALLRCSGRGCSSPTLVVGSSLPQRWARTHKAFVLSFSSWRRAVVAPNNKRPRLLLDKNNTNNKLLLDLNLMDDDGCIDLTPPTQHHQNTHAWFRDATPIVTGCSCLACMSHSRAYLYHLVCAKELLAEIMLFVHNLHHLLALVDEINNQANNDDDSIALADFEQYLFAQTLRKQVSEKNG